MEASRASRRHTPAATLKSMRVPATPPPPPALGRTALCSQADEAQASRRATGAEEERLPLPPREASTGRLGPRGALTSTCPESEAAFATDVVKTLSADAPTLATVTVVTSATQEPDSAPTAVPAVGLPLYTKCSAKVFRPRSKRPGFSGAKRGHLAPSGGFSAGRPTRHPCPASHGLCHAAPGLSPFWEKTYPAKAPHTLQCLLPPLGTLPGQLPQVPMGQARGQGPPPAADLFLLKSTSDLPVPPSPAPSQLQVHTGASAHRCAAPASRPHHPGLPVPGSSTLPHARCPRLPSPALGPKSPSSMLLRPLGWQDGPKCLAQGRCSN